LQELDAAVALRLKQAEEAIYTDPTDPMVNWDVADLVAWATVVGLRVETQIEPDPSQLQISAAVLQRWFAPAAGERPSYGQRLAAHLSQPEVVLVQKLFERQLLNQTVTWTGQVVYLLGAVQ